MQNSTVKIGEMRTENHVYEEGPPSMGITLKELVIAHCTV